MKQLSKAEIQKKFSKDFVAFQTYSEMQQLIAPLRHLNVKNFGYRVNYYDGRFSELNDNPEFIRQYYLTNMINESYSARFSLPNAIILESAIFEGTAYFQRHRLHIERVKELFDRFFFSTSLAVVQNYPDRYEVFLFKFPAAQEGQLMDIMVHRQDLFYRFVQYFQDRGKNLLKIARQQCIQLPWNPKRASEEIEHFGLRLRSTDIQQFLCETDCKRWHLSSLPITEHLTGRELDMVSLLAKGKSLVQIRQQLGISEITVAYHMKNIKKKLGSRTLFDLGFKLGKIATSELSLEDF